MQQLIFMFYIIPSDSFNTPDQINNSQEGGTEEQRKETDPGKGGGGRLRVAVQNQSGWWGEAEDAVSW